MPKTTKFDELRAKMRPEARAEARRLADKDLKQMPLHELRAARHLTQQQLAQTLNMTQAAFSETFGIPVPTLKKWEARKRVPEGPAKAYLMVIDKNPAAVKRALQ